MPTVTSPPIQAPPSQRRMRWWIILGVIIAGIVLYGLTHPKEPGADWFAPIDYPQSEEWKQASRPAGTWLPVTNDNFKLTYEVRVNTEGKQEIQVIEENPYATNYEIHSPPYDRFIQSDLNNTITLPNGAVVKLSEVIAYPGNKEPPLCFQLNNGVATLAHLPADHDLFNGKINLPSLQFVLSQTPADTIIPRAFSLYESSSGHFISNDKIQDNKLFNTEIPYMPQSPLHLLLQCYFGGTYQVTIPAEAGSFVETDGIVVRYCGDIVRKADEQTLYNLHSENPSSFSQSYVIPFGKMPNRLFVFAHTLGALKILSIEALFEDGEKITLPVYTEGPLTFCAIEGQNGTTLPRSFVLTLPRNSARIAFTIPQIQELWPTQNVKNRFDLRFSAMEASYFKHHIDSNWWSYLMEKTTGVKTIANLDSEKNPALDDVDLRGKTVREAFVIYFQRSGNSPEKYTTAASYDGTHHIFERKKSIGTHIWRWIHRHPDIRRWLHDHDLYDKLEKIGIKGG